MAEQEPVRKKRETWYTTFELAIMITCLVGFDVNLDRQKKENTATPITIESFRFDVSK